MKKLLAILLSVLVVFAMSTSVLADTATVDGSGSTPVQFQLSDTQISATVPLSIVATVGADGELTFANTAKIVNTSIFPVYVSSISCAAEDGWTLAASDGGANDTIVATVKGGGEGTGHALTTTPVTDPGSTWNMTAAADGTGDEVALTLSGNVYKLTKSLTTTAATAFTITFTISTGATPIT